MHLRAALAIACLIAGSAAATDYRVTRYDDPVPDGCTVEHCSLREAVLAANAAAGLDRILLSAGLYYFELEGANENAAATGDLDVTDDLELIGPGATMCGIDANGWDRHLHVAGQEVDFTLRGIALSAGLSDGFATSLLFEDAGSGLIEECSFFSNNYGQTGNLSQAVTEVRGFGFTVTVRRTTIADNTGSGVAAAGGATVEMENSTISANTGFELRSSDGSSLTCTHCTILDDENALAEIDPTDEESSIELVNSLVVGDCELSEGTLVAGGGNLESPGATCGLESENVETALLLLNSLGDYGGPTPTILPDTAGDSVNVADDSQCLPTDQRGLVRPAVRCDIGATEEEAEELLPRPATPIFHDGFEQGSQGAWTPPG